MTERPNLHWPLELWGGVECTYNRVGEAYFNQLEWNGHAHRLSDLDLFAELGLRALRYPVIWDALAPRSPEEIDWDFPDERLNRLRELNIRPIAGLVHHGSGPRYANIATAGFAPGLADFARRVAERFPWLDAYTPVNEPLTTARFCGLYGHWHPHGRDNHMFVRVLLNECVATCLAMQAVRKINPAAQLVQTDDLGRVYSTPQMSYQAHFENQRRWLSFDLLCGRVNRSHIMWQFLMESGANPAELDWLCDNPCPPDIIGLNYYPTSDRFLDENFERFPESARAFNGREKYADFEAIRVLATPPGGFKERLQEIWERYSVPVAITEAHLGCSREEQLRWTAGAWRAAQELRKEGVPVRAVTAWSLLGAKNWNSLVTRDENHYEPGIFDVRGPSPRPTALAHLLRHLASGEEPTHPVIDQPGWWQRSQRILGTPASSQMINSPSFDRRSDVIHEKSQRPLLILGRNGALGKAFAHACDLRGLPYYSFSRSDVDLCDRMSIEMAIDSTRPWAVINATGYRCVQEAENDAETCFCVNVDSAFNLAEICARNGIGLVCFSSDLVFDGQKGSPYSEHDATAPLNVYGKSKAQMEMQVLQAHPSSLIARTSAIFGVGHERNFLNQAVSALRSGRNFVAIGDALISPTYAPDLVSAVLDLLIDGAAGLWNLTNAGASTWADLSMQVAGHLNLKGQIQRVGIQDVTQKAAMPNFSVLGTERGQILPPLTEAVERYCRSISL